MNYLQSFHKSFVSFLSKLAERDMASGKEPLEFDRFGYGQPLRGTATGRYVVLRANFGLENERLMNELSESVLYQIIPWDTEEQKPQVYLDRQWVAVEAPLPRKAQNAEIQLSSLTGISHGGQVVILGPNEAGVTISLPVQDLIHVLIGGETGSGKTYTMRQFAYQVSTGENRIVLIDGKRGDGLGILDGLPGQVGPLAIDTRQTIDALGWVYQEMMRRYEKVYERGGLAWQIGESDAPRQLIVFFDEFQVYRDNTTVMNLINQIVAMGRSARIHLIAGTQKPTVRMFGPDGGVTRDQFSTRIAHSVRSYQASNAIVGSNTPRADYLMPKGDAYIIGNVGSYPLCERVQIAYVPESDLYEYTKNGKPEMAHWPSFDACVLDGFENEVGRPAMEFDNKQIAVAVYAAQSGYGRGKLQTLLEKIGEPIAGTEPANRLLKVGREIQEAIQELELTD